MTSIIREELDRSEISTLLYFENCVVNDAGRVDARRINDEDRKNAQFLKTAGLIEDFGRICAEHAKRDASEWVKLTDKGFEASGRYRKERAARMWASRTYKTTAEKRAED